MKPGQTVKKWDNNLGVRAPTGNAAAACWTVEQRAQVPARGDATVIEPTRRQRHRLDELLSRISGHDKLDAADCGPPVAKERP